jgi:DNA-binding transcriptional ArsR family regulator
MDPLQGFSQIQKGIGDLFLAGRSESSGKNFSRSKLKVKINFKTLRTRLLPILKYLEAGNYPAKIARMLGFSKPHVFYYVKKLEQAGLVRRIRRSSIVIYEVTRRGSSFLTGSEGVLFGSGVWRLHAAKYRFGLVVDGVWPVDWRRVAKMNWTALLGLEGGVTVEKTPSSVIVHVETLYGRDPVQLLDLARGLADRTAKALMSKYGCRLAEGKLCRKPHIAIDDPVAEFIGRYFELSTGEAKIDQSEGIGEIDHLGIESAVEYMLMPERIKKVEGQLETVNYDLEKISGNIDKITAILSKLVNLEEGQDGRSVAEGQRSMKDYVA